GLRKPTCTGRMIKKCSLAVIGKVSAPASRIQVITNSLYWLKSVDERERNIRVLVERKPNGSLEIIFSDTGPGIESKYKDQIFEPYFSRKPEGHGLGLCLVGEIVHDYYNGTVELLDTGKTGGAAFRIVLKKRV
ncbi:ATP-binding protein, partial [Halomonas sp. NPDC076908]|uniref:ATP-binding protein n=1 Tax=Halomonas sp. NPDC076908 TaxID=3390567 RepID=UPI003D077341